MFQRGKYGRFIHTIFALVDFVVLNLSFLVLVLVHVGIDNLHTRLIWLLLNVAYIPSALWMSDVHKERPMMMERVMRTTLLAIGAHALCFITLLYLMELDDIPWTVLTEFYILFAALLMLWRISGQAILKRFRRLGGNIRRIIIIGCGNTARRLYEEIYTHPEFGYEVMGFFDIYCPPDFPYKDLYRGNLRELSTFAASNRPDELYYTLSGEDQEAVQQTVSICDAEMTRFYFVPRLSHYLSKNFRQTQIGTVPVMAVLNNPLESNINAAMKRGFDILFSSAFLLVSPLIFIPVAIAIKLTSPGPVFFRQRRTGYMGNEFWCYKFRTMHVNNDADSLQASKDDPRKTSLGDFLRRTSIDELPQFYNVLRGEMSVVGPRPHMLKHTEDYSRLISNYMVRHFIKPGITGWAQVMGYRGQTEELWQMERRVEHDIWYIEHWSFLLDVKIIIRTIINALHKDQNAF
ncbi:MAG: undecaprenyl-phosphate glucose phosphotransferase [Muribaculaceae bacterium]|nr:undecaprenyl-phosphate glucose phosphotransferase [Muribaculaceae bacterium]